MHCSKTLVNISAKSDHSNLSVNPGRLAGAFSSSWSIHVVCEQQRLWSDCASAQSDLSLCCSQMPSAPFRMSRLDRKLLNSHHRIKVCQRKTNYFSVYKSVLLLSTNLLPFMLIGEKIGMICFFFCGDFWGRTSMCVLIFIVYGLWSLAQTHTLP